MYIPGNIEAFLIFQRKTFQYELWIQSWNLKIIKRLCWCCFRWMLAPSIIVMWEIVCADFALHCYNKFSKSITIAKTAHMSFSIDYNLTYFFIFFLFSGKTKIRQPKLSVKVYGLINLWGKWHFCDSAEWLLKKKLQQPSPCVPPFSQQQYKTL